VIKKDLPSGAVLEIFLLPFSDAWNVSQNISSVLEKLNIDLKELAKEVNTPADFLALKGPILALLSNKEVFEEANKCFKLCVYNKLKIDKDTFESKESRGDFIACVFFALSENIAPFFVNLVSFLAKKLENKIP